MDFAFSDDQLALRDSARRFLADRSPLPAVRKILDGDAPFDRALWRGLAEMGYLGVAAPEAYGGLGLGYLELCVIAEELGRSLAATPFASSVYLATEALLQFGGDAQKQRWLPRLVEGAAIGAVAIAEGPRAPTPGAIRVAFADGRLDGVKSPVADGDVADVAIVLARSGGEGERGLSLCLVELGGPGVSRTAVKTIDPTRSHASLVFDGAPAELLGAPSAGWAMTERLLDRAATLVAFEQVGGAEACLEMARDYALGRIAFGRPIASFQAIKHKLADVYVAIELARANSYYAAWALAEDSPDLPLAAAAARVAATEAFHLASKENIQVHGGMGFTWEFDCHLYYRRAKLLALQLGAARVWKDRLIRRLEARNAA